MTSSFAHEGVLSSFSIDPDQIRVIHPEIQKPCYDEPIRIIFLSCFVNSKLQASK